MKRVRMISPARPLDVCFLVLALMLISIPVCLGAGAPAPPAATAPAAPSAPTAPTVAPAGTSEEEFHYVGTGRRDPFKSLLVLQEKKKDYSKLPPIQQVDLQVLKVLGVVMDQKGSNRAMIQTPDGKTYVIKKGDIIGKNEGEVVSIGLDGITIREQFLDFMKKETVVTTVLKVSEKQK
jgi:Tfp pilus assembly protein PilP